MVTEDYVSFETAKLLKERGFDRYPLFPCYKEDNGEFIDIPTTLDTINYCFIPAPTLQMAMKWLREKHNLYVDIILHSVNRTLIYEARIDKINSPSDIDVILPQINEPNYENACEAAIKYCLENLI